ERGHRLALALELERPHRLDLDRVTRQPTRLLADQDLAWLRRLLQPCGDVDGVTRGEPFLRAGDHLAGADADSTLDAELREGIAHLRCRAKSSERVVLVHDRDAKNCHDRVADEFLNRPTVRLDDLLHTFEIP